MLTCLVGKSNTWPMQKNLNGRGKSEQKTKKKAMAEVSKWNESWWELRVTVPFLSSCLQQRLTDWSEGNIEYFVEKKTPRRHVLVNQRENLLGVRQQWPIVRYVNAVLTCFVVSCQVKAEYDREEENDQQLIDEGNDWRGRERTMRVTLWEMIHKQWAPALIFIKLGNDLEREIFDKCRGRRTWMDQRHSLGNLSTEVIVPWKRSRSFLD